MQESLVRLGPALAVTLVVLAVTAAASSALLPALDQTRTVGLVTLPGAYVGLLLAGASPVEAGAAQLLVLVALLAVESVAVVVVLELVAAGLLRPGSPGSG